MRFPGQVAKIVFVMFNLTTLTTGTQPKISSNRDKGALRVFFVDTEGGKATFIVPPTGENLLIDTGNPSRRPGPSSDVLPSYVIPGRDASRILAICKLAGVNRIDNLVITHYHLDHIGGLQELAVAIPIGRLIDHGENREPSDHAVKLTYEAYEKLLDSAKYQHLVVKPFDLLPLAGVHVEVVSADGNVIDKPVAGGGAENRACETSPEKPIEDTENDRSIGMVITFGKFHFVDLSDLTWGKERLLMCPTNKLGKVDVYVTSHHGLDRSGSPALLDAIAPRIVIMNNGGRKGGTPSTWDIIQHSPRIGALWQLHTVEAPNGHNVPDTRIANLKGPDEGYSLELIARKDGSFSVTNQRTGESVQYAAK